jgi:aminoglycoside phosphotransferase (APT) family kinase protein
MSAFVPKLEASARRALGRVPLHPYSFLVDFRPIGRPDGNAPEPVTAGQIFAMCRRVLGESAEVRSAVELGWGSYNTAFRVELAEGPLVVLRIAPSPDKQMRSERHWLRSEYAATAWLVGLGSLVPRVLGADFTHQVIGRDYLVQSFLPGVPAPDKLPAYDRKLWPGFFSQLGAITRRMHNIVGDSWGPLAAPVDVRWSDALLRSLTDSRADLAGWSLPAGDVTQLCAVVERHRDRLDHAGRPRLLHGDLWTANILLDPHAIEPTVTGVVDADRAWWGDPLADWSVYRADSRAVLSERDAFWRAYGGRPAGRDVEWRLKFYRGRHLVAERVEAARGGHFNHVDKTVTELGSLLSALGD